MVIYIEYVIIDNLIIDYLIINFTGRILSVKFKTKNIVFALFAGIMGAMLLPLISLSNIWLILAKLTIGVIMVVLIKKHHNFRDFLITCIALFTITFLFGGMCCGLNSILGFSINGNQILLNSFEFPISIFLLFASLYLYLAGNLIIYVKNKSKLSNFYFDVVITQNNREYELRGYLDSGNKLFDDSAPVVVIPIKVFSKVFVDYPLEKIPLGNAPNNPHYIRSYSVGGVNNLLVLEIDKILIKNNERNIEYTNVKLGISKANFSSDFDLLLHSSF